MKKILLLLFIASVALCGYSQNPVTKAPGTPAYTFSGNETTLNQYMGLLKAKKGLINGVYADTATANLGYIDAYAGAMIFTTSDGFLWYRNATATKWLRLDSSTGVTISSFNFYTDSSLIICYSTGACDTVPISNFVNVVTNIVQNFNDSSITNIGDSLILFCVGFGAERVCDTLHLGSSNTYNIVIHGDSVFAKTCDTLQTICTVPDSCYQQLVCDSILLSNPPPVPIYQNGLQILPGTTIREFGNYYDGHSPGAMIHDTYLYTGDYGSQLNITGRPNGRPPLTLQQQQFAQNSSSIFQINHLGAYQPTFNLLDENNPVNLYINYTDPFVIPPSGAHAGDTLGFMGNEYGYLLMTNAKGVAYGYGVDDINSKQAGIFLSTYSPMGNNVAVRIIGNQLPAAYNLSNNNAPDTTLIDATISAFKTNGQVQFPRYGSTSVFSVSDTSAYKPGVFDADGNIYRMSYWPSGGGGGGSNTDSLFGVQDNTAAQNRSFNSRETYNFLFDSVKTWTWQDRNSYALFDFSNKTIDVLVAADDNSDFANFYALRESNRVEAGLATSGYNGNMYTYVKSTPASQKHQVGNFMNSGGLWIDQRLEMENDHTNAGTHWEVFREKWTDPAGGYNFVSDRIRMDSLGISLQTTKALNGTGYKGLRVDSISNLRFENYPSTRNDGNTQKVLYIGNSSGDVKYGYLDTSFYATQYDLTQVSAGITADNGITANTATNVQLGSLTNVGVPFTTDRYINVGNNTLFMTGIDDDYLLHASTTNGNATTITGINSGGGQGVFGSGATGVAGSGTTTGVDGTSTSGDGVRGTITGGSGAAGKFTNQQTSTNTVIAVTRNYRTTTGTAANGIGGSHEFYVETADGAFNLTNQIISKLTTAAALTRVSQLIITGVDNAVTADLFTLSGNGALKMNKYGVGSFTSGTATYLIATDASGNWFEYPAGGIGGGGGLLVSADNGLTTNTATNVQLGHTTSSGSPLLHDTYINTTTSFSLLVNGGNSTLTIPAMYALNQSGGQGLAVSSFGGSDGSIYAMSVGKIGNSGEIVNGMYIANGTVAANGMGVNLTFKNRTTTNNTGSTSTNSNYITSTWVDATDATRTSQLDVKGVGTGSTNTIASFYGSGVVGIGISSAYTGTRLEVVDNTLGNASMAYFHSSSTAAAGGNGQKVIEVLLSGANATASQTTHGIYVNNTHTGTGSVNIGIYAAASGGVNGNIAVSAISTGQTIVATSTGNNAGYFSTTAVAGAIDAQNSNDNANAYAARLVRYPTSTNTIKEVLRINRQVSGGVGGIGVGASVGFYLADDNALGFEEYANLIESKFTTVTHSAATSTLTLKGVLAGASVDLLTLAGDGSVKLRPITATAASAITPAEGMIVMVSSTNGTFTAIGFWGYANGAWVQF